MIRMNDFKREASLHKKILKRMTILLQSGHYILGNEGKKFEKDFAQYIGTRYAIGVGNGMEALQISLMALGIGPGDEVITVSNSAVATALAITNTGAKPIFVDVDKYHCMDSTQLECAMTKNTKAIIPVHMFGQPADMNSILKIAKKYKLHVVEDSCQAHGAKYLNQHVGSFGDLGCFSFYPTKNLGAYGDGGAITTNSKVLYERCKMMRNYGQKNRYHHDTKGLNSRLDEIQAAILSEKLPLLDGLVSKRRQIAQIYRTELRNVKDIKLPQERRGVKHSYHLFVIETNEQKELISYLKSKGVEAQIHYPIPIHKQRCYSEYNNQSLPLTETASKHVVSLPISPYLNEGEVKYISKTIKDFYHINTRKRTATIGIPAHNEEKNIGNLLNSILKQKGSNYMIEKIIVVCDGCTDNTANIVKSYSKRNSFISILDDGKRIGQPARLNELYRINTSDIFITFDADTTLGHSYVIRDLVSQFKHMNVGLVGGVVKPYAQDSIIGKALVTYELFWSKVTRSLNSGNNVHNLIGPISAMSKELLTQISIPPYITASDHFLYFKTKELGYSFNLSESAYVYFKVPNNLGDFINQTSRFHNSLVSIQSYFGNWTLSYYHIPMINKLKAYASVGMQKPIYLSIALLLQAVQRIYNIKFIDKKTTGIWHSVASSK